MDIRTELNKVFLLTTGATFIFIVGVSSVNAAVSGKVKSSCKSRLIEIPENFRLFEESIIEWIGGCVKSRSHVNGKAVKREIKLVKNNHSLKRIWNHVSENKGSKVNIIAKYVGKNKVTRIKFSYKVKNIDFDSEFIQGNVNKNNSTDEVSRMIELRFYKKYYSSDIKKGNEILHGLMKSPLRYARKIASMPENPVKPGLKEMLDSFKDSGLEGTLRKYTIGGIIDVLTANASKGVAKARAPLYDNYSYGLARGLDKKYRDFPKASNKNERLMFELGKYNVKRLSKLQKHQLRVHLIDVRRRNKSNSLSMGVYTDFSKESYISLATGSTYRYVIRSKFNDSEYRYR